jgi:hypothetical protein
VISEKLGKQAVRQAGQISHQGGRGLKSILTNILTSAFLTRIRISKVKARDFMSRNKINKLLGL